jgi:hypothetical protein
MPELLRLVGIVAGALLAVYLIALLFVRLLDPFHSLLARAGMALASPFSSSFWRMNQKSRRNKLENEIRRALGQEDPFGDDERRQVVNAAISAQEINLINQRLRESVRRCLRTHWAIARASGATHMAEAARHPLSRHLRDRVIDLTEFLIERIAAYPLLLDSVELIGLHVGLRWIPASCTTCPFWSTTVSEAPAVCPTAKAMFGSTTDRGQTVLDAEVIDQCD